MQHCSQCNTPNPEDHRFCMNCGAALGAPVQSAAALICPRCKSPNPADSRFCGACGYGFENRPLSTTTPGLGEGLDSTPLGPSLAASASGTSMSASSAAAPKLEAQPEALATPANPGPQLNPAPQVAATPESFETQPSPAVDPDAPKARLVLLQEDGSEGGSLTLRGGPQWIGRNHGAPFDDDAYLDGDHAAFTVQEDGLVVDAEKSLNGIFFKLEEPCELLDNDQFRVGQELIRYQELRQNVEHQPAVEILGSPNPGYWGRLSVMATPDIEIRAIPLDASGALLGREAGDLSFPSDGYVSARHCRIYTDQQSIWLEDLESSNGTYMRVRPQQKLPHGALLLIGQQLFRLESA